MPPLSQQRGRAPLPDLFLPNMTRNSDSFDVIIAGAGPAGSSAAIHLARSGFHVLLIEQKKFPRPKLCGEFISPECEQHFHKLGVAEAMIASGPSMISETVFYSARGHHVTVPSSWFGGSAALGLSRAVMDDALLRRAQDCGVVVLEAATIHEPVVRNGDVRGVRLKVDNQDREYHALITIDATGRARILTRKLSHEKVQNTHVAFKVHLRNTRVAPNACEIYFYPGGYGGLSSIEGGLSNLCFITSAEQVKRHYSNPEVVVRETVMKNRRAAYTLEPAQPESEWLSASWERFGRQRPSPAKGLLAIGDSAAFIDPFTGSGMLMAFESGELAAEVINRHRENVETIGSEYAAQYVRKFESRLRICGLLRRAAFKPRLASLCIAIFGASDRLRSKTARATRTPNRTPKRDTHSPLQAG